MLKFENSFVKFVNSLGKSSDVCYDRNTSLAGFHTEGGAPWDPPPRIVVLIPHQQVVAGLFGHHLMLLGQTQ